MIYIVSNITNSKGNIFIIILIDEEFRDSICFAASEKYTSYRDTHNDKIDVI